MGRKRKQFIATILALTMLIQVVPSFGHVAYAKEDSSTDTPTEERVWSGETTDEILQMAAESNLDFATFFQGDLSSGITEEDLRKWKSQGQDIRDVILDRAKAETSRVSFWQGEKSENESEEVEGQSSIDENGEMWEYSQERTYYAPPITATRDRNGNPMYYITRCDNIKEQNIVDMSGTPYEMWLHNPKSGKVGKTDVWSVDLGYARAMCVTYNARAGIKTDYHYTERPISEIRNNPYFNGGDNYPVEAYYRGAAFAYERLMGLKGSSSGIANPGDVYEANLNNLYNVIKSIVGSNGKTYIEQQITEDEIATCFQIISWRIAGGDLGNGVADENAETDFGGAVYNQMYHNSAKAQIIKEIYRYFIKCAEESKQGDKESLYGCISVKFFAIQGDKHIKDTWQDFVTWNVDRPVTGIDVTVTKTGTALVEKQGIRYPNATFRIYSNRECTNYLTEFVTDSKGEARLKLTTGDYYLKEVKSPTGAVKSEQVLHLPIRDNMTSEFTVGNEELYNYLILKKYDSNTRVQIEQPAVLELYEEVGDRTYKICNLSFTKKNRKIDGIDIPAFSYYVPENTRQQYHNTDGTVMTSCTGAKIYYTPVNRGTFKIVERNAPGGYSVNRDGIRFDMDLSKQGALKSFITYGSGLKETPFPANVEFKKYDTFSKEELLGAEFELQELVQGTWVKVGNLVWNQAKKVYTTDTNTTYLYHRFPYNTIASRKGSYPLIRTTYNNGRFRIVETKTPQGNYKVKCIREFTVAPTAPNYTYRFVSEDDGIYNTGTSIRVKAAKYDAITKELVTENEATMTVYEFNTGVGNWQEIGTLNYNTDTGFYECSTDCYYTPHNSAGELAKVDKTVYEKGKLYFTSVNQGKYKLVETAAPTNYELGLADDKEETKVYEKEIYIGPDTLEGEVFDFTDYENAAIDTPVNVKLNLAKIDRLTKEKVATGDAEFTVYENIQNEWLYVGKLVYDSKADTYAASSMKLTLHNSSGMPVYTTESAKGLYYTSANKGEYKIAETKAPTNYQKNSYEKEFNITQAANDGNIEFTTEETCASDLGISENLEVSKLDGVTKEKVNESDAEFTVYEFVNSQWLESGKLVWNPKTRCYVSEGARFVFHDKSGNVIDSSSIEGYNSGKLYYTTANSGRYKVTETKAPSHYTGISATNQEGQIFEKEFVVDKDDEKNCFITEEDAARNMGVYATFNLLKYDYITNKNVEFKDAVFQVEENINGNWMTVATMLFDEKSRLYTTRDSKITLHNSQGEQSYTNHDGRLYYTNANEGKYRVVEKKAPTNYVIGATPFCSEFRVLDANEQVINLTSQVDGAHDIGISGTVEVSKFDFVTKELVKTDDALFTVYEYVNREWIAVGTLIWNNKKRCYDCSSATFQFHNEDGSVADSRDIPEFKQGVLYYTSANKGKFKVAETKAPSNYTKGEFDKEFVIDKNGENIPFVTSNDGALNRGVGVKLELKKYDLLTKQTAVSKDAIFLVEEFLVDTGTWAQVGYLTYDAQTDSYCSKGMNMQYHDGTGKIVLELTEDEILYTSANLGKFRVSEVAAPEFYERNAFEKEFQITEIAGEQLSINSYEESARDIGISGTTKVAKFDKITGEKVLTGDAEFTVYEQIGSEWLEVGKLVFDKKEQEYVCTGATFVFHNLDHSQIDTSEVKEFGAGRLYYTTANRGKFKLVETKAPSNYVIDGFEKEFDITKCRENSYTDLKHGAKDSGFSGKLKLSKVHAGTNQVVAGADFTVQEWSEAHHAWLSVGALTDQGNGYYTTDDMKIALHTGNEMDTVAADNLYYTTQNLGKYRIIEKQAPIGYLNEGYISEELVIQKENQVFDEISNHLEVQEEKVRGRVVIHKTDEMTGNALEGAVFELLDESGNVIDTLTTDTTGKAISKEIEFGIYGEHGIYKGSHRYTLVEIKAPKGYQLADDKIEFTFEYLGEQTPIVEQTFEITNKPIEHIPPYIVKSFFP